MYLRRLRDEINRLNEEAKSSLESGIPKEWLLMLEYSLAEYQKQRGGQLWDPDITIFHLASDVNLIVMYLERQRSKDGSTSTCN